LYGREYYSQHYKKVIVNMLLPMRILIAEDESAISMQYQIVLEERGHEVKITNDGEECLEAYLTALSTSEQPTGISVGTTESKDTENRFSTMDKNHLPFDIVILDYKMPRKDGLETAKAILDVCPSQRVMFASAYTVQTLTEAVKTLHKVVELLQKPFDLEYFVEAVEDKALYEQLERLNVRVRELRNFDVTHSQLVDLLAGIKKLQRVILHD
jgi:CheY-like chemotaxis protein